MTRKLEALPDGIFKITEETGETWFTQIERSIPTPGYRLFQGVAYEILTQDQIDSTPELEDLGRESIRSSLETRLGKPVVSRDTLNKRFGLKKLGYTSDDILSGRILVR